MRHRIYPSTCTITKHPSLQAHYLYKEVQSSNLIITPPPRLDTETSTPTPQTHPKPSQSRALPSTSPIPVEKRKKSPSAETQSFQPSRPPCCGRKKASAPPRAAWRSGGWYSYSYISLRLRGSRHTVHSFCPPPPY